MEIKITFSHIERTDSIEDYLHKRLETLEKFGNTIISMDAILSLVRGQQQAEANIHVPGKTFNAKAISNDLYFSIDELERKLTEQLKKFHEKLTKHRTKKIPEKKLSNPGKKIKKPAKTPKKK